MLLRALKRTVFVVVYLAVLLAVLAVATIFTVACAAMFFGVVGHAPIVIGILWGACIMVSINRVTPQRWIDWMIRA